MFSIGEFSRHGRVSVRMLHHYDAIGLLVAALVDPESGYRFYEASQLQRLNRIIALKDLGFTLQQVAAILSENVGVAELRGMLMLRRAELHAQISADTAKLARVEARMRSIESESRGPAADVVLKHIAPVQVAELSRSADSYEPESITPVIQPLYRDLFAELCSAGIIGAGPAIAYYEDCVAPEGAIEVHAAVSIAASPEGERSFQVVDLPELATAATLIHKGSMDDVLPSVQALARWIDANGYRSLGYPREVTLEAGEAREQWVTELQEPVARRTDEETVMNAGPELAERAAQSYAGISGTATMASIGAIADRIPEIFGWLAARGVAPAGPPFLRYNVIDMPRELEIEAGVPIAASTEDGGDIQVRTLPAGRYAVMTHIGEPATLAAATQALLDWAAARDLTWDMSDTPAGQRWGCRMEIYLTDPSEQPDMTRWRTQLAFRLAD